MGDFSETNLFEVLRKVNLIFTTNPFSYKKSTSQITDKFGIDIKANEMCFMKNVGFFDETILSVKSFVSFSEILFPGNPELESLALANLKNLNAAMKHTDLK